MKGLHIVREAWRDTWRQIIPTLLLFVVSIGATLGALLTAGQQVAQQQILHNQLKDPAARFVMIRDPSGELLNRQILTLLQNTSGVESAIGVGEVLEVESLGAKITAWAVTDSAVAIETTRGRALTVGEGVIDESLLSKIGWDVPSGAVYAAAQREIAVVAGGKTRPGFSFFADAVLVHQPQLENMRAIAIMAERLVDVPTIQAAIHTYTDAAPGKLTFESSGLSIVDRVTSGDFARYTRSILFTVVGLGTFLTAVVSLAYVLLYRRTLGRRRALGITRIDLAALTLIRMAAPNLIGAVSGAIVADVVARIWLSPIPLPFTVAVVLILVITSGFAALVPIAWAVNRDPVAILRTA
ncbi:hypothetical protein QEV69_00490 [Trueperella pyogenes]|uniref:hypothetical protein n=1 Tax=Trueperella pyogenes TaxID=1661 RepID=UPI00324AD112